ncbi:MAG TPA: universal stress protein [Candidatus Limnocylindrales bacterium]|nr:universal stress protein [Candidatus Limnocylindrales bacterium]
MRVLLALDGSAEADHARALVVSTGWPSDTAFEVLSVIRSAPAFGLLGPSHSGLDHARTELLEVATTAASQLADAGFGARANVRLGRPATTIVAEADRFHADLVVVGSRGFGPISTMVLGSVSAEVADRAPCPVLVVRGDRVGSLLVGVDGSETADCAIDYLAGFRLFADRPTTVVSVVPPPIRVVDPLGGMGYGMYDVPPEKFAQSVEKARTDHLRFAGRATRLLANAGFTVETEVCEGDPAHVLIGLVAGRNDPIVVLGTHGRTGVSRAFLGSVARNVLLHSTSSVLVVRGPVRERSDEVVRASWAEPRLVGARTFGASALATA